MKKIFTLNLFFIALVVNTFAQYYKILDFNGATNGSTPMGSLISDGTFLYGMTVNGGTGMCSNGCDGSGVIFKIKPDGTGYVKLHDFDSINARSPVGSLVFDGVFLYGMTQEGGTNNLGTLFKIKSDGTGYSKLIDFAGATNGKYPTGKLLYDGTFLYGTTFQGGTNNIGIVFKIKPDGTGFNKLLDFDGANGENPYCASFISDGTFLYGTTTNGGLSNGNGTIFKIKPDGSGDSVLHSFAGSYPNGDGSFPTGSLIFDGTFLYGATQSGGINDFGVAYKVKPDGTGYSSVHDFTINEYSPVGSLFSDGRFLYGMTTAGGVNGMGILYKVKSNGSEYSKMFDFDSISGGTPALGSSLVSDGIFLYGMTGYGGANNKGTIFKNCIAQYSTSFDTVQNTFNLYVDSTITALATGYQWSFGDGALSSLATPSHTYTSDSVYNICMKIYLASGDSCIYCHSIGKDSSGAIFRNAGFTINVHNANSPAGISQNLLDENNITVFPNPTNGIFQVLNTDYLISGTEVYNLLGESIYEHLSTFPSLQIDLSNQPNGIYFLSMKTDKGIRSKKIVLNKSF
jgi:uncharacterized repeat protein (TIGR03803 family)